MYKKYLFILLAEMLQMITTVLKIHPKKMNIEVLLYSIPSKFRNKY